MTERQTKSKKGVVWLSAPMCLGYALTVIVLSSFWLSLVKLPVCPEIGPCRSNWDYLLHFSLPNEIGDTLAGFAGTLAFIWLVVTVIMQGVELREQRFEFKEMNTQMELQRRETTFFAMLSALENAIRDIDLVNDDGKVTVGRDCFRVFYTRLTRNHKDKISKKHGADMSLVLAYRHFWNKHQLELSQYFKVLESILRFVSDEPNELSSRHVELLKFQLSDQELLLIYYHTVSEYGSSLREYVTSAALFEFLPTVRLLDVQHGNLLDRSAFGSNPMKTYKDFKNPLEQKKT